MDANTYSYDDSLPRPKRAGKYTPEEVVQLGLQLLCLKKLTSHGEFINRVELLGYRQSEVYRYMRAAKRLYGKSAESLLKAAGNVLKLDELMALEDDEIDALKTGGEARGITLQSLPSMSAKQVRTALRGVADKLIDARLSIVEAKMLSAYREQAKEVQDVADKRAAPVWELRRDLFTNRCMVTL